MLHVVDMRFIPAGAGNTNCIVRTRFYAPVYPRWRGEHNLKKWSRASYDGLSPLARGTPVSGKPLQQYVRFIPAGAGNTISYALSIYEAPVYPRWRGEHNSIRIDGGDRLGLSPLARGTRLRLILPGDFGRFIPAGAGNTNNWFCHSVIAPVYPRWRGEHFFARRRISSQRGLSPLARGTLSLGEAIEIGVRFIPAGAGNTDSLIPAEATAAVYPRWRGEHKKMEETGTDERGLSPLARGTLNLFPSCWIITRFIPAGAGNTTPPAPPVLLCAVYPRWRGEHNNFRSGFFR